MILVLSTYRTGGTNLCKKLAEDNGFENLDECFHESLVDSHKDAIRYIARRPSTVVKLFPYHISHSPIKGLLTELVNLSTQIIMLVRKDFDQQCQSYYICKQINNWHDNFEQPADITLDKDKWQWCVNFLHNQYLDLSELRQRHELDRLFGIKLMFTHQLEKGQKYNRPVKWDKAPGFTNIDIEELFLE
jgi:hypothetical protein